ncbi:MAG: hypothetical protein JWM95_1938 [Gemmatimonadetes bacterium]|nr:hypothetical protein [Gemmatimonadota bacterium]
MARGAHAPRAIVLLFLGACAGSDAVSSTPVVYVAQLRGVNEVPVVGTSATGTATVTVAGASARYTVTASGFATTLNVGHIHIGGPGVIGPVIVPFTIVAQTGTVATGSIDLAAPITFNTITISGDSLRSLFESGQAYVNLHSAAAPGGEIRGQILRK